MGDVLARRRAGGVWTWVGFFVTAALAISAGGAESADAQDASAVREANVEPAHTARAAEATRIVLALSVQGDANLDAPLRDQAMRAIVAALDAAGLTVLEGAALAARTPTELRGCARTDCAEGLVQSLGAEFAVRLALWADARTGELSSVAVTLVEPSGETFNGEADATAGDVGGAAARALELARSRQRAGRGASPSQQGALASGTSAGRRAPARGTESSVATWLGWGLVGLGVGLLALDVVFAAGGECAVRAESGCKAGRRMQPGLLWGLGLAGGASIAGGGAVLVFTWSPSGDGQ